MTRVILVAMQSDISTILMVDTEANNRPVFFSVWYPVDARGIELKRGILIMIRYSHSKTLRARIAWVLVAVAFIWVVSPTWAQDKQPQEPATLPGCEDQVRSGGPGGKQERFFPLPLPKVKAAATEALQALEFKVKKDTNDSLEAHKARHMGVFVGSGGEKVQLNFKETEQDGQKGTMVTGETKKNVVGIAGQKTWTGAVLAQTACVLQKDAQK